MMSTDAAATNSNPLSALADLAAMSETERAASRTSTSSSVGSTVSRTNSPGETDCCRAAAVEKDASAIHSDDVGNVTCSKDDNSRRARSVDAKEEDVKMDQEMDLEQELVNQDHPSSSPSFADREHPHDCHEVSQESLFSSSSSLLASSINNMNIHNNDNNGNCGSNNHDDGNRRSIASEEQKLFRQRTKEMNRRPAKKRAVPSDLDMGFGMKVHPNIAAAAAAASGKSSGSSSSPSLHGRGAGAPSSKSNGSKGQAGNSNKVVKANVKSSPRSPNNVKGALNSNGCQNGNPKKKKSESLFNSNNGHDNPTKKIRSKKTSHSSNHNHNSTDPPPSFPVILMAILSSPHTEGNQTNVSDVISFLSDNQSFIVVNPMVLEQEILPNHFGDYRHGHSNGKNDDGDGHGNFKIETFHEFQETLLYWGFTCESDPKYPKVNVWRHPMFRKGDWEECMKITLPEHSRLRSDQEEDGADDVAKEAGAGRGDGRDGDGPKKFPPKSTSFGGTTVKRPLYREYYSRDDDEEFGRQQFLRGHIHHQHQRRQQQHHPLAHAQQEHLLQQRHQQQLQPRRDRPESPPREENEANERHRNQQMMDHNARSVTPSGESIDGERHPGNATGANQHIQLPRAAVNAAVSSEAPYADFESSSSQLESVKQAVLRRAMAMEASPAFSRRHSDLMVSATQNMNLMYPPLPGSNHGGIVTGGAGGSAAVDHSRLRLERDYQSMTDVELQEYRRQLLLEREHCLRASLGLGYNGRPSESTMMNKMGVIRRGPIFTGGSGRGMDTEASYLGMMGFSGNSGDHSMEAATAVAAMPRRYSALGVQSLNDPDGMLSSSSRLTSHPYNGASESLLPSSRWNPRERSSSMPLGMQSYHRHDGMIPQQRAPSDEDVKMATEDVVSAALDALRRGEAAQQQQEQQQKMFQSQQELNHQRPLNRGPHPRSFKRSRRHTVDHVPSSIAGANSGYPDTASASAAGGVPPAMNLTSPTSSLDAMTEQFLERSRARLSGRPMGISMPSNSLFALSSSASRYGMDHSSTGCNAADFNQHSGNSAVSGGAYFSTHRKNNVGVGMHTIGNAGTGGMAGSISNGNNAINGMVSSRGSLMASVGAEVDAQARAILAQRRASMSL